jgi:hypothetical protein
MSSFLTNSDPSQPSPQEVSPSIQEQSAPTEVTAGGDAVGPVCCLHDHDHDHEPHSDEDNIPPINRIIYPADVIDLDDDMEVVTVIGTR